MFKQIYADFITPEKNSKKIGIFRILCAIFGGLFVAYLGMMVLALLVPGTLGDKIVVPLLFNTLAWAIAGLWIIVSPSKLIALLRSVIPIIIFSILIITLS